MSHPFGDLLSQYLHRKHGLSQARLAAGIFQDPAIISWMCKGKRLAGDRARERILVMLNWLFEQGVIFHVDEADALLMAAGMTPLSIRQPVEARFIKILRDAVESNPQRVAPAHEARLPISLTPFIGREHELATLAQRLAEPDCRLITLAGPGGAGKTRLAMALATRCARFFADGVCFVDLQPVASRDGMPFSVADALRMTLSSDDDPWRQLQGHLAGKHLLLVLDNLEHLIEVGAEVVPGILAAASDVKLVITSRHVLNVQGEWQHWVHGVAYPSSADAEIMTYDAVRLFVDSARRVLPDFTPDGNAYAITRICQLTEGLPLAIEMAAAWVKTLSCSEIVHELERGQAVLSSPMRNAPARQSSMEATFAHSWQLMTRREQDAFARLSVFRGGFTRKAAEQVAGTTSDDLAGFVDKSLLQRDARGSRFRLHELMRQFAEAQLSERPEGIAHMRNLHGSFFSEFLWERLSGALGHHQIAVAEELDAEFDNIRAAWQWMVEQGDVAGIDRSSRTLSIFANLRCRYLEMCNGLEAARCRLDALEPSRERDLALIPVLCDLSWVYLRFGRLADLEQCCNRCRELYQRWGIPPVHGTGTDPALALGITASIRGDYELAAHLGKEALKTSIEGRHLVNQAYACYVLASAAMGQGDYVQAKYHAQESYGLTQINGDQWFAAYSLIDLGNAEAALGDLVSAKAHYSTSYEIRRDFGDAEGMAVALSHLGHVALQEKAYSQAEQLYQKSLAHYNDINDEGGRATAYFGLGSAAAALNQTEPARLHLCSALQIAHRIQYAPLLFATLVAVARLLKNVRRPDLGHDALMLAWQHHGSPIDCRKAAAGLLVEVDGRLPALTASEIELWSQADRLDHVCHAMESTLSSPFQQTHAADKESLPAGAAILPTIDRLTEREAGVLQLISEGLSNQEIAGKLHITSGTVKFYTSRIYAKLCVNSRTQAIAHARRVGLLS